MNFLNELFNITIMILSALLHTAIKILIGWLLIDKVPAWLGLSGIIATIIKIIGILIIINALLFWI